MIFLLNVLASLVASLIILLGGAIFARRARHELLLLAAKVFRLEMSPAFKHQRDADNFLSRELRQARWVKIITGRGKLLESKACEPLWSRGNKRLKGWRLLLPDPGTDAFQNGWLVKREKETLNHDETYVPGRIAQQVRGVLMHVDTRANSRTEVRLYDFPHLCRLVITDRVALFTPYSDLVHGTESPCYLVQPPGPLYDYFVRYFETVWKAPTTVSHPLPSESKGAIEQDAGEENL